MHRFWEANGTAYMAMPVMRGSNLRDIRQGMSQAPDEAWLRRIVMPLLGAIEKLHSEGVYHRDIAPDNIQIEPDGSPVLLDFGAARRVLSDKSQALTAILKPAYAPIEQYAEAGSVKQGPWTDIYALGATLHYLLLGRPPPPATARAVHDEASQLTQARCPGCSEDFLLCVDWMLTPRPTDRPQSVARLRDALEGRARPPPRKATEAVPVPWERTDVIGHPGEGKRLDVDVGDGATQFMPSVLPQDADRSTTEHVWLEGEPDPQRTGVYRAPGAADGQAGIHAAQGPAQSAGGDSSATEYRPRSNLLPAGIAMALLVAVVVGVVFWPASAPAPAPVPEPSTTLLPAAPAASALTLAAPAVSSSDAGAAPAALASSPAPAVAEPSPAVVTVEAPAKPAATKPNAQRAAPPPKPGAAAAAEERKPKPEVARARPEPTAPPAAAIVAAPEPAAALGPAPSCGSRESVRYHVCMERECGRSEFSGHPACQR